MKIAVSTDSGMVSAHFGRCPEFTIAEIYNGKVKSKSTVPNPGHRTGFLPSFLSEKGVKCVIAGGAGMKAQQFFAQYGIDLITGVQGNVDDVIHKFAVGKLAGGPSFCKPGKGKGYGIEKEDHKQR
jgi:predicted Fe-Mo cluster-binding NifX family protein